MYSAAGQTFVRAYPYVSHVLQLGIFPKVKVLDDDTKERIQAQLTSVTSLKILLWPLKGHDVGFGHGTQREKTPMGGAQPPTARPDRMDYGIWSVHQPNPKN